MYFPFLITIIVFILPEPAYLVSGVYNRSVLMAKYPSLGKDFIMFPNGENGVKMGYLDPPEGTSKIFDILSRVEDDVTYTLYTRNEPNGVELSNYTNLPKSFDKTKKTIFQTHGWMSSGKEESSISIKNAYLKTSDVNVFVVDWSPIAGNIFYVIPMRRTRDVGAYYSRFLNYLVDEMGMNPNDFHLIGHSLGAHVSGFAARGLTHGKIGRISGLDPALPGFDTGIIEDGRLNRNDASFVDIIHTSAGYLGLRQPLGHADFYPNGGTPPQPGCTILEVLEACSHGRSWELFSKSIVLEEPFMASKCASFEILMKRNCSGTEIPMGDPTPRNARGVFYLETTDKEPYIKT